MATLNDVANLANVSKMTVSRVINHPEKVTDELKDLVYQAMQEVDYHPNVAAKALVNNRTQIIKFLILEDLDATEPYYMKLLMGIAMYLSKHQYSLQLVTKDNMDISDCDAYIITGMRRKDVTWIKRLSKPVVIFGENHDGLDYIDVDNQAGTQKATELALQAGYEHIVFIGINVEESFEYAREAGYLEAMQEQQQDTEIYRMDNHSQTAGKFLQENWEKFKPNTCFICASDRLALGVERFLQKEKLNLPQDYGVVGFDGVFINQIAVPNLTTVEQPEVQMGEAIAKMTINKVVQNGMGQGNKKFDPTLIIGGTTK